MVQDLQVGQMWRRWIDGLAAVLLAARELWRALPEIEDDTDRFVALRLTFRLLHLADIVTVTTAG
jgi:hypothetical protein